MVLPFRERVEVSRVRGSTQVTLLGQYLRTNHISSCPVGASVLTVITAAHIADASTLAEQVLR